MDTGLRMLSSMVGVVVIVPGHSDEDILSILSLGHAVENVLRAWGHLCYLPLAICCNLGYLV